MKKDATENDLIANNDIFADILNGNRILDNYVISPEELTNLPTESSFKDMDGEVRKLCRDSLKKMGPFGVCIFIAGIENQTDINNAMPIRDMGYAYTAYQMQVRQIRAENIARNRNAYARVIHDNQRLKPVFNFILYFGKEEWTHPLSLKDILEIPEELKKTAEKYLPDYPIHVISVRNQPEEVRKRYKSDFAVIADALAYEGASTKKLKEYLKHDTRILTHPEQTLNLLSVLCGSKITKLMYDHYLNNMAEKKKEETTMANVFDDIFEDMQKELDEKYKDQREELENAKNQLEDKRNQLEDERNQLEDERNQLEDERNQLEDERNQLERQKEHLQSQENALEQKFAEISQQKAEVDQQKAEVDQQKAEIRQQKFTIIKNLIAIWDIPTISAKTGYSVAEIRQIVEQ